MNTKTEAARAAVGAPVEAPVRPVAWAHRYRPGGLLHGLCDSEHEAKGDAKIAGGPAEAVALYDQATLDAAVAAARERNAGWFALVMNAAAALEDAANCLQQDPDARRAAEGAAKHYRAAANALWTECGPNAELTGTQQRG